MPNLNSRITPHFETVLDRLVAEIHVLGFSTVLKAEIRLAAFLEYIEVNKQESGWHKWHFG